MILANANIILRLENDSMGEYSIFALNKTCSRNKYTCMVEQSFK